MLKGKIIHTWQCWHPGRALSCISCGLDGLLIFRRICETPCTPKLSEEALTPVHWESRGTFQNRCASCIFVVHHPWKTVPHENKFQTNMECMKNRNEQQMAAERNQVEPYDPDEWKMDFKPFCSLFFCMCTSPLHIFCCVRPLHLFYLCQWLVSGQLP